DFAAAASGAAQARMIDATDAAAGAADLGPSTMIREFLPIAVNGNVLGVVCIWRDATPILERLDGVRRDVVVVTISAGLVAAALLFLVFRAAQARLSRQATALLEASRRDPLTGVMNHGAIVGELAIR